MEDRSDRVRTPLFPLYSGVRHLLILLDGVAKPLVVSLIQRINDQTGTPQNPVDWSNPDEWIPDRLTGEEAALALRLWTASNHTLNPRHIYGGYLLLNSEALLIPDAARIYHLTARGSAFLREEPEVIREVDGHEGIFDLLRILAPKSRAMRGDLLPEWLAFLTETSRFRTLMSAKDTLRRRLLNLAEREFITREGNTYTIAQAGLMYIGFHEAPSDHRAHFQATDPLQDVTQAVQTFNQAQRSQLRQCLTTMPPYRFEHLVRDLLEAMGYNNVEVTRESGDMGVDVVATIEFGITTITEVVQVKRQQGNIQRPVLDQLRGALPYQKALRGTIITLGKFSQGCIERALFPGAAPIGLIDGEKLIDLLIDHEIGIKKRPIALHELNPTYFISSDAAEDVAEREIVIDAAIAE